MLMHHLKMMTFYHQFLHNDGCFVTNIIVKCTKIEKNINVRRTKIKKHDDKMQKKLDSKIYNNKFKNPKSSSKVIWQNQVASQILEDTCHHLVIHNKLFGYKQNLNLN